MIPDDRMVHKRKKLIEYAERRHFPKDTYDANSEKVWKPNDHCFQIRGMHGYSRVPNKRTGRLFFFQKFFHPIRTYSGLYVY